MGIRGLTVRIKGAQKTDRLIKHQDVFLAGELPVYQGCV